MDVERLTHLGICVSDLEASLRFYRDALGCEEVGRLELEGAHVDRLNGLPGSKVRAAYVERDGWRLELMDFAAPRWEGPRTPRAMNRPGLTHLSFRVADLDAVCARVEAAGGALLPESHIETRGGAVSTLMVLDPDGMRIELIQGRGDPNAVPGSARYMQE